MWAQRLVQACLLFLTLALLFVSMYAAFIGIGHMRPDFWVSDLARTFDQPPGRYFVSYTSNKFEASSSNGKQSWPHSANTELVVRTGGGKIGIRRLRLLDDWLLRDPRNANPTQAIEWHFDQFGLEIHMERSSDCVRHPHTSHFYLGHMDFVVIPWWIFTIILGWYPALILVIQPIRRSRRRRRGLCVKCGYDLTGTPQPRCPECGTPI